MIGKLACLVAVFAAVPVVASADEIRSKTVNGVTIEAVVAQQPSDPDKQQVLDRISQARGAVYQPPQTPADVAGMTFPVK